MFLKRAKLLEVQTSVNAKNLMFLFNIVTGFAIKVIERFNTNDEIRKIAN